MRIFIALVIAACVFALPVSANHALNAPYRWRVTNLPLNLKIDDSAVSSADGTAAQVASANWSTSTVVDITQVTRRADISVVYGTACLIACTSYRLRRNSYIESATVILNQGSMSNYTAGQRQNVLCHEVGHALGLDHQNDLTSCMYPTTAGAPTPNAHDYEELELIYGG